LNYFILGVNDSYFETTYDINCLHIGPDKRLPIVVIPNVDQTFYAKKVPAVGHAQLLVLHEANWATLIIHVLVL
jgi:hypothetical protein